MEWDVELYVQHISPAMTGRNRSAEQSLLRRFPPADPMAELLVSDRPVTIVDVMGRIIGWILPNVLGPNRQVSQSAVPFNQFLYDMITGRH